MGDSVDVTAKLNDNEEDQKLDRVFLWFSHRYFFWFIWVSSEDRHEQLILGWCLWMQFGVRVSVWLVGVLKIFSCVSHSPSWLHIKVLENTGDAEISYSFTISVCLTSKNTYHFTVPQAQDIVQVRTPSPLLTLNALYANIMWWAFFVRNKKH